MTTIALLPGDGIGSEVLDGPVEYLRRLIDLGAPIELTGPWPYGSTGWQATGSTLPRETLAGCAAADVVLSGAVGSHPGISASECPNPEAALIELRARFDLRVSIRRVCFVDRPDTLIVRNIIGGAYVETARRVESIDERPAEDRIVLVPAQVREVLRIGADLARQMPGRTFVSVDKASVLATSRLWRRCAREVAEKTGLTIRSVNVDRAAYELALHDELPGMIATEGLFGDILSDLLCARAGSPALCASATVNPGRPARQRCTGLFEPAHGSSPTRTGTRTSNPAGAWLSLAALFEWCPDLADLAVAAPLQAAVRAALTELPPTYERARAPSDAISGLDEFNAFVLAAVPTGRADTGPRRGDA